MATAIPLEKLADKHASRRVLWRILPSKARGPRAMERSGNAKMWADEAGTLNAESEDLGLSLRIQAPDDHSRFEFSEPLTGLDLTQHNCARLKHGSIFSSSTNRKWDFFLVIEGCSCTLISTRKRGKQLKAITSNRIVGFMQDKMSGGYKIVVFKEKGRMSPIFEFSLTNTQFVVARGPLSAAMPTVAQQLEPLRPSDKMNWVAPHMRQLSTSQEVNLLDLPMDDAGVI